MSVEHPAYWLVYVPESTEEGAAEVAAVAPEATPRQLLGADGRALLVQVDRYHELHPHQRIVFVSELTGWLDGWGYAWTDVDVHLYEALRDLDEHAPGLLIEASPVTLAVVANTAREAWLKYTDGAVERVDELVEAVRAAVLEVLERDWPAWVRSVLGRARNGRVVE
jgi:hypothetical protein